MNRYKRKAPAESHESKLEYDREELTRRASILFDVKDLSAFDLPSPPLEKKLSSFFPKVETQDLTASVHKFAYASSDVELMNLNECYDGDDIDLDESNLDVPSTHLACKPIP